MKAIETLLSSEGTYKLIYILWGEPLLKKDIIKSIIEYASSLNQSFHKSLSFIISTSWVIAINQEFGNFLNSYDVKVSISIDGNAFFHDKHRTFLNWKWSFRTIQKNIQKCFMPFLLKENVFWVITVFPDSDIVASLFKNYLFLVNELWFTSVHISNVKWYWKWTKELQIEYLRNFKKILDYVLVSYKSGEYLYINSLNRYFCKKETQQLFDNCIFRMIEIHSDGMVWQPLWSHLYPNNPEYTYFHIFDIDTHLQKCMNSLLCECSTISNIPYDKNYLDWYTRIFLNKYSMLFWDDYKNKILTLHKYI
jgi:sulfatase maturation enzyme AslB (radical SAM superfamily)